MGDLQRVDENETNELITKLNKNKTFELEYPNP